MFISMLTLSDADEVDGATTHLFVRQFVTNQPSTAIIFWPELAKADSESEGD